MNTGTVKEGQYEMYYEVYRSRIAGSAVLTYCKQIAYKDSKEVCPTSLPKDVKLKLENKIFDEVFGENY